MTRPTIWDYLKEHGSEVDHVTRSALGTWSITLKDKGNVSNRTISSCGKLSTLDCKGINAMGIRCVDWLGFYDSDMTFSEYQRHAVASSYVALEPLVIDDELRIVRD